MSYTTDQIVALSSSDLQALSSAAIQALSQTELQAITTAQLQFLTTTQILELLPTQIREFATAQIRALSTTDIAALTTNQVRALTAAELGAMTTAQLANMSSVSVPIPAIQPDRGNLNLGAITAKSLRNLAGTRCLVAAGLVGHSSPEQVATANTITFMIDGKMYSKVATTAIVVTGGILAISSFRWYVVQVDSAGTMTIVAGTDNAAWLPALTDGCCIVGAFKVVTDSSHTFTPTSTSLVAAGITTTYFDLSVVPTLGYPQ